WIALAGPIGPRLWMWVLHPSAMAPSSLAAPGVLAIAALLLAVAAIFLRRRGGAVEEPVAAAGPGLQVFGSPRMRTDPEHKRRGTQPYEVSDEIGHRPTEIAKSGAAPAGSALPAWNAGIAGRAAELAAADAYPDRERVLTGASTLGRYRLLERLGGGGRAELYTAVLHGAEGFRRVYVVKRLRPEVARNRAAVAQFSAEAKLGS